MKSLGQHAGAAGGKRRDVLGDRNREVRDQTDVDDPFGVSLSHHDLKGRCD